MDLLSYFQIIKRRIWVIVITIAVTLLVAFAGRTIIPASVEVTTTLRFTPPANASFSYTERIMNTFIQIAESQPIIDEVLNQLGLDPDIELDIIVRIIPDSELVEIKVKDPDPILAQRLATTYTQVILDARPISDVRVTVIEPASAPEAPSLLDQILIYSLTGIVGLVGGIGLAFLFENLDTGLRNSDMIEQTTGLKVIGEIPHFRGRSESKFILDSFPFYDSFLRLRTNILSKKGLPQKPVLAITSAVPEDGKSTVSANIVRSFGLAGLKTVLIDTDMIQPTIHKYYDLNNNIGLSSYLIGEKELDQIIDKSEYLNVDVITSGPRQIHSADLLRSEEMMKLLKELHKNYDLVVMDTAAILSIADGLMVIPQSDGVVLVSNFNTTTKADILSCIEQLKSARAKIIGVIINKAKDPRTQKYYSYYQKEPRKPRSILGNIYKEPGKKTTKTDLELGKLATDLTSSANEIPQKTEEISQRQLSTLNESVEESFAESLKEYEDTKEELAKSNHRSRGQIQEKVGKSISTDTKEISKIEEINAGENMAIPNGNNLLMVSVDFFNKITMQIPSNISTFFGSKVSSNIIARKRWQKLARTYLDDDLL